MMRWMAQLFTACVMLAGSAVSIRAQLIRTDSLPPSQSLGGCFIVYLVNRPPDDGDLAPMCDRYPTPRVFNGTTFQEFYGGYLVPLVWNAMANALDAYCQHAVCIPPDTRIRVYLVVDGVPNAWSDSVSRGRLHVINIGLTTSLVNMIGATAHSLLLEALASRVHTVTDQSFSAWLDSLYAHGGLDCDHTIPVPPPGPLPSRQYETEQYVAQALVYEFILAHELAHLLVGPTCGQPGPGPTAELACDSIAIDRMNRTRVTTSGPMPAMTLIATRHYDAVIAPMFADTQAGQAGLDKFFSERDWSTRASAIERQFNRACGASVISGAACDGYSGMGKTFASYLARPIPRSCKRSPREAKP